jgi:hypothetical protein
VREYVLYDTGHPKYKNLVKKKLKHGDIYPKNWTRLICVPYIYK